MRPRDRLHEGLCGATAGEATLYLQREFHGLSTTVAEHARAAEKEVDRHSEAVTLPMTTLAALCEQHAPAKFEFLKVDVEGAEADVLRGADFSKHRPKIIVVEAIKPLSLAPAWDEWEPMLARHGYAYVWDDELNRYYVAQEARALADRLTEGPKWYADGPQIGNFKPAADDPAHPDHRLALLLRGADMATLPLQSCRAAGAPDRRPCGSGSRRRGRPTSRPSPSGYSAFLPQCSRSRPRGNPFARLIAESSIPMHSAPPAAASRRATRGDAFCLAGDTRHSLYGLKNREKPRG